METLEATPHKDDFADRALEQLLEDTPPEQRQPRLLELTDIRNPHSTDPTIAVFNIDKRQRIKKLARKFNIELPPVWYN